MIKINYNLLMANIQMIADKCEIMGGSRVKFLAHLQLSCNFIWGEIEDWDKKRKIETGEREKYAGTQNLQVLFPKLSGKVKSNFITKPYWFCILQNKLRLANMQTPFHHHHKTYFHSVSVDEAWNYYKENFCKYRGLLDKLLQNSIFCSLMV